MKKIFAVLLMPIYLLGMVPQHAMEPINAQLVINNLSTWDIDVYLDGTVLKEPVHVGQKIILPNANLISSLKIAPHGRWWGLASRETLTAGLAQLPDEAPKIQNVIHAHEDIDKFQLNVSLPPGFTGSFKSFIIDIGPYKAEKELIPPSRRLEDIFPAVKQALHPTGFFERMYSQQPIEPRRFLNVEPGASRESIQLVYERQRDIWDKILTNPLTSSRDKEFAEDVLQFLNLSRTILISELDLQALVNRKFRNA